MAPAKVLRSHVRFAKSRNPAHKCNILQNFDRFSRVRFLARSNNKRAAASLAANFAATTFNAPIKVSDSQEDMITKFREAYFSSVTFSVPPGVMVFMFSESEEVPDLWVDGWSLFQTFCGHKSWLSSAAAFAGIALKASAMATYDPASFWQDVRAFTKSPRLLFKESKFVHVTFDERMVVVTLAQSKLLHTLQASLKSHLTGLRPSMFMKDGEITPLVEGSKDIIVELSTVGSLNKMLKYITLATSRDTTLHLVSTASFSISTLQRKLPTFSITESSPIGSFPIHFTARLHN